MFELFETMSTFHQTFLITRALIAITTALELSALLSLLSMLLWMVRCHSIVSGVRLFNAYSVAMI
jgi:hypothetical protein